MSGFRWTQMFLMLLHLAAVTGQYSPVIVRDGDEVTLPCENVSDSQSECENTSWLFSGAGNTPSVELIELGRIGENAKAKLSDRLSVTADCSLVIKKVTVEDVGRYTCRQFRSGEKQGPDAHVYLSVITRTEYEDDDVVTLSCSVSTYAWCSQRVTWLFKGKDIDEENRDVKTSQSYCSANVTFRTSHYLHRYRYGLLLCHTTDIFNGKVQRFIFSPQSSGEDATTVGTTERSTKATTANNDPTEAQDWLRYIIVSAGLAALIIIVVAVNLWTRAKGNKTQTNENTVHTIKVDGTVTYENLGDPNASIRLH